MSSRSATGRPRPASRAVSWASQAGKTASVLSRRLMADGPAQTASKGLLDAGQLAGVFNHSMIPAEGTNPADVNAWVESPERVAAACPHV
jgi:hypothetical protein